MPTPEELPAPVQMTGLLAGFQVSQALFVVARLDLATVLADGSRTIDELAAATGAKADPIRRLIRSLAPLGIFRTHGDTVEITPLGATLAEGRPGSVRDLALYWMETHYAAFGDLLHTATTGEPAATHHYREPFFDWISKYPSLVEVQNNAMGNVTRGVRAGMFDGYLLPPGHVVADIGGADGSMIAELLANDPDRQGIVFDLPEVVPAARKTLAASGLQDRVGAVAGNFFESVPAADVYILSYILHDWDDESSLRILRTVGKAAAPGARIVLVETVIPPGDAPHLAKSIDLTMLAMLTGRERTGTEYAGLLDGAGFTMDRIVPTSTPYSFIEAVRR